MTHSKLVWFLWFCCIVAMTAWLLIGICTNRDNPPTRKDRNES